MQRLERNLSRRRLTLLNKGSAALARASHTVASSPGAPGLVIGEGPNSTFGGDAESDILLDIANKLEFMPNSCQHSYYTYILIPKERLIGDLFLDKDLPASRRRSQRVHASQILADDKYYWLRNLLAILAKSQILVGAATGRDQPCGPTTPEGYYSASRRRPEYADGRAQGPSVRRCLGECRLG